MSVNLRGFMGGGVYDSQVLRAMADLGAIIDIPLMSDFEYEPHANWRIYKIPIRRQFKLGFLLTNFLFLIAGLWLKLKGEKYNFIRVHSPYHTGLACLALSKIFNAPFFVQTHHIDPLPKWRIALEGWILKRAALIFAVSNFARSQLLETFKLDESKIFLTSEGLNTIDVPSDWQDVISKMGLELGDKKVLTFVGTLSPRKNVELLFDVLKLLPDDIVLIVIGGDPPNMRGRIKELKALSEKKGCSHRVYFLGSTTGVKKGAILARTDVFVFPSLLEGFGMAVVEAMSLGIPCVVSNRASLPEIIQDGVCGFLADPDNPKDFAEKIKMILDNPELRARMSESAREVAKKYSWRDTARGQLEILKNVLEKRA